MTTLQARPRTRAPSRRVASTGQFVSSRSIADPEAAADVAAFRAEMSSSPDVARAFLQQVGIINSTGKLTRRYGGR